MGGSSETAVRGCSYRSEFNISSDILSGSSSSASSFGGQATTRAFTHGQSQSTVPILADMPSATYSLDELIHEGIVKLRDLPPRTMVFKTPTKRSQRAAVPIVKKSVASARTVAKFYGNVHDLDPFSLTTDVVKAEIDERRGNLESEAKKPKRITKREAPEDPEDFYE